MKREVEKVEVVEQFFKAIESLSESDLLHYIDWFLNRKHDKIIALKELHERMNRINYLASNFYSFYNNQFYYPSLISTKTKETDYYTIEELAKKMNICERTINNWEKAGLRVIRPSPRVLIVSKVDLYNFFEKDLQ